ncbi:hypothetical protein [Pseudomonas sp. Teo4]|uniref:hypothetical protein n=1 Tax=Pseudomonas sp. Teo4 TaxID=3064528 RepID=UPI002AB8B2F1|nr:hypothetical protein [Pseudomonas sp. Teo4]MDZ3994003.1 hypothetical protein [Pseudomonas sp. Teo4]
MDVIEASIWILLFLLAILVLGAWVYAASRYVEQIEACFPNSDFVKANKSTYSHAGMLGKMMRVGSITVMLSMNGIFVRKGLVDSSDISNFPASVRRNLLILWYFHVTVFAGAAALYLWVKCFGR